MAFTTTSPASPPSSLYSEFSFDHVCITQRSVEQLHAMELRLAAPKNHYIFLGTHNESYSLPVLGSVEVTVPSSSVDSSSYPRIRVGLARTVTSEPQCLITARRRAGGFFKNLRRQKLDKCEPHPISEAPGCSSTMMVTQCDLWHIPDHVESDDTRSEMTLRFNFAMPILMDIPSTTKTVLGTVSYEIIAISTSIEGPQIIARQPIQILRRTIPGYLRTVQHVRTLLTDKMIIVLDITPSELAEHGESSYMAKLSFKRTTTHGPRSSEMRYVVIKEIKWRVEETVKVLSIADGAENSQNEIVTKEERVRELCNESRVGRWLADDDQPTDDTIQISFDVTIPKHLHGTEDMDLSTYDVNKKPQHLMGTSDEQDPRTYMMKERVAITTSHQLKLEVIAGEDTFDKTTGRLVDRKPLWKSFPASFPLPLYSFASPQEIPDVAFLGDEIPPMYEATSKPPDYAVA